MTDDLDLKDGIELFSYHCVNVRISLSARFVRVVSVFDVVKTDINNSDEENGYCVMMVLANSKNVIKIFFPLLLFSSAAVTASSPHSIILLFSCCAHYNQ